MLLTNRYPSLSGPTPLDRHNTIVIDLRSDTATQPTPGMRGRSRLREVGDEQIREDPTVNDLESRMAEILAQEEAVFVPTATMANEIALRVLGDPGDELIAEEDSTSSSPSWAAGGFAGLMARPISSPNGRFTPEQVRGRLAPATSGIRRRRASSRSRTRNSSGGRVWPLAEIEAVAAACRELEIALHIDGARLFNAAVASGQDAASIASHGDTVTICFSKGLGCPFGAVVAGSRDACCGLGASSISSAAP